MCERIFTTPQALGGHMSKSHPHMSEDFRQKQIKRQERTEEREIL
jgi:hypothetical protein